MGWQVGAWRTDQTPTPGYQYHTYAANNLNQYTSAEGQAPAYDNNGNLTQFEGWNYSTNAESQVTRLTPAAGGEMEVRHDPLGRVFLRKFPDGTRRRYFYDGASVVEEFDENNVDRAIHVHAPGVDHVLVTLRWGPGGYSQSLDNYYRLYDACNTVTHLVHAGTGAAMEAYRYDAFGQPWRYALDGSFLPMGASQYENRYLFTGREWFPEVGNGGLYDYRARIYHPRLGRFVQADPIRFGGGDTNMHRYCGNDPVNRIDPAGLLDQRSGVNIFNQAIGSSPTSPAGGNSEWNGWDFGPGYTSFPGGTIWAPSTGPQTAGSYSTSEGTTAGASGGGSQIAREALEDFGRFGAGLINRAIGLVQGTVQVFSNPFGPTVGFANAFGQALTSFSADPIGQMRDYFSSFGDPDRAADAFAGVAFNAALATSAMKGVGAPANPIAQASNFAKPAATNPVIANMFKAPRDAALAARASLSAAERELWARHYADVAARTKNGPAIGLNVERSKFLRGETDLPPGNIQDFW